MITQIELDGFKTFKDFTVELAPFQVIVGPNGAGKSNLFDALQLLSRLAGNDLLTAFQGLRGDANEVFTKLPDGRMVDRMRMAVDLLIDREIRDDLGRKVELKFVRLRYELQILLRTDEYGLERPYIMHESLKAIPRETDSWCSKHHLSPQSEWLRESATGAATFIDTSSSMKDTPEGSIHRSHPLLHLYGDGQPEQPSSVFNAYDLPRTLLSAELGPEYHHILAARQELRSVRFFHLNPEALRQPSSTKAPRFLLPDGGNLPTTLARMQTEDKFALNDVSLDLANLVPDLVEIGLQEDKYRNEYMLWAKYMDERSYSSRVLSDGTLRLLALTALKNDPQFHGVLCLEEPENGVHPSYFTKIARLLRSLATDFNDPQQIGEPLRQVLITTHSTAFITQQEVLNTLLFMYTMTRVEPLATGVPPMSFTHAAPVLVSDTQSSQINHLNIDKREASYTIDLVKDLLAKNSLDEAIERLEASRSSFDER
jgi:predicted ATPase